MSVNLMLVVLPLKLTLPFVFYKLHKHCAMIVCHVWNCLAVSFKFFLSCSVNADVMYLLACHFLKSPAWKRLTFPFHFNFITREIYIFLLMLHRLFKLNYPIILIDHFIILPVWVNLYFLFISPHEENWLTYFLHRWVPCKIYISTSFCLLYY
jgi:hypothetical protein